MHTFKKYYKLLFYRLYKWHYNKFGEDDLPALTALGYISILSAFNVTTVLIVFDRMMPNSIIIDTFLSSNFWKLFFALGILAINYLLLCYNGKGKKIIAEQEGVKKVNRKRDNIIIAIYIICSPIILVLTLIY